jgi:endo-1,3(4)-beta-glucanase
VQEEWDALFAPGTRTPAENVTGGWKGILFANLAIVDPTKSWDFFAQPDFDLAWIDGGASRTWYLAYAAGEFVCTWRRKDLSPSIHLKIVLYAIPWLTAAVQV